MNSEFCTFKIVNKKKGMHKFNLQLGSNVAYGPIYIITNRISKQKEIENVIHFISKYTVSLSLNSCMQV